MPKPKPCHPPILNLTPLNLQPRLPQPPNTALTTQPPACPANNSSHSTQTGRECNSNISSSSPPWVTATGTVHPRRPLEAHQSRQEARLILAPAWGWLRPRPPGQSTPPPIINSTSTTSHLWVTQTAMVSNNNNSNNPLPLTEVVQPQRRQRQPPPRPQRPQQQLQPRYTSNSCCTIIT
jgi:hypothetical protein